MKRSLLFAACLLFTHATFVRAQAPFDSSYEPGNANPITSRPTRTPLPNQVIYERARFRAEQRTARIEARNWMGVSLLRPPMQPDFRRAPVTPYAGAPWIYGPPMPQVRMSLP